jgi:uncharacterized protein YyaL (SSP411 family)
VSNRLAQATSPYLLQHADNPVDWWEWSQEAFDEARRRDVPIFLSIGYSACHWCHVMAHESFENAATAEYLNANFVSIKVDREERPDIDSIYMEATVAMTGHGGWPMSVFMDHEGRPFYTGTYFPPEPRHQMSSFPQLLQAITDAWNERRDEIEAAGQRIIDALSRRQLAEGSAHPPALTELDAAVSVLMQDFDPQSGGFGGAPKFPPSMVLEFLIRYAVLSDAAHAPEALDMTERTLEAMARGGMYDQLGGGFARYSVDDRWVVPHFEKMLYDNALLLRVYLHFWRLTGSALAQRIVRETAEFLVRDMTTPEGGFASALDADSEGVEGKFYAWTPEQLVEVLGVEDGTWAAELFHVTPAGTFEHGTSTLQLLRDPDDWQRWELVRSRLFEARELRVHPGRDDKVVASWNGLAIAALAEAGQLLGEPSWIDAAVDAADLLIAVHLGAQDDDRLCRTSKDGLAGNNLGVLDDYGSLAEGLLVLAQVTGEVAWLQFAGMLLDITLQHFADGSGGFFDTANDAPELIRRPKDPADNAEPSGWFAATNALLTYAALTGSLEHREAAERALGIVTALAEPAPRAVGWGLVAASALLVGPLEVAVVIDADARDGESRDLVDVAFASNSPGTVVAWGIGRDDDQPLLRDRSMIGGQATAYVCRGFVCDAPVTGVTELAALVRARTASS